MIEYILEVLLQMFQVNADYGRKISESKMIFLEIVLTILFENISRQIWIDLFSCDHYIGRASHP